MSRLIRPFRCLPPLLAVVLALALGGCSDSSRISYPNELDEPDYREGQALLQAGRRQEALTAFLKVIDKRRDDAPESHLSVGLLYVQHINDPLSAIYHFRKYLALRPNSPQAPLVRQRINAAIREFARTLPAQPLENQPQRVDLVAALDQLRQENESLKRQLAEAKANRGSPTLPAANPVPAPATTPEKGPLFSLEATPIVRTHPAPPASARIITPPTAAPVATPAAPRQLPLQPAPAPAAAGPRKHTVRPGDTLFKLAQQYYNNRAKWRDIYQANRGVIPSESAPLKVGMELKIP
ncbi:MAG TPA: LysM peptidoglycan-binding domain-containing protein [Lacunisphaera sp.]|nr:LysM peptidoglycan-binding domain-containing protein [Lacunisphaera sp.]